MGKKRQKSNMLVHIHQLIYIQQRNGEGGNERINYTVRKGWNRIAIF
jgi:hypothetical protein